MANRVTAQGEVIFKDHLSLDKLKRELELAGFSMEVVGAYAKLQGRIIPGGLRSGKRALVKHLDEGYLRFTSEEGSWTWEIRGGKLTEPTEPTSRSWWGRLLDRLFDRYC